MTTKELVELVIDFGQANSVDTILAAGPYLEALGRAFGDLEVRQVTARELCAFHRRVEPAAAEPVVSALESKAERWEPIYLSRKQNLVGPLPWESASPVGALVERFEQPGFRPRTVLELGCGDGVNAIFMATRGCEVTAVDVSNTALEMARAKASSAGVRVEFVEGDVFELPRPPEPYDLVFDRGLFHHLQVFQFEDYKHLVADRLAPDGHFHLICHDVSTRPTLFLECLCGSVGKLLGLLSGILVQTGSGFTAGELRESFSDRFRIESIDLIEDDMNRPFRFQSAVMRRIA